MYYKYAVSAKADQGLKNSSPQVKSLKLYFECLKQQILPTVMNHLLLLVVCLILFNWQTLYPNWQIVHYYMF